MGEPLRSTARFPGLPLSAGHYESFYLKASHPAEPVSVWIRYTVHKRPGAAPLGSLWFTLFDSREDGPWAVKATTGEVGAAPGEYVHVGDARFEPGRVLGSAAADVGPSLGNAQLFMDLTRAGAVAEMHIYQKGRHGFGGGFGSPEFSGWMPLLEHFLQIGGFLPGGE